MTTFEIQNRYRCLNCMDDRNAEIAANGSSVIPYQFNEANAKAHLLANVTHVVSLVTIAVAV